MALDCRPDVTAYRLGILRAEAEVRLAQANRMSDVYLLYQPYTFQNNAPFDRQSATSWALGVTVPLPLYNRNQGNIQRARINVAQSQVELAEREQQVDSEVRQADREYVLTRPPSSGSRAGSCRAAERVRDDAYRLYTQGEEEAIVYLNAQREYNEAARQYRDMLVRHRRSMLRAQHGGGPTVLAMSPSTRAVRPLLVPACRSCPSALRRRAARGRTRGRWPAGRRASGTCW